LAGLGERLPTGVGATLMPNDCDPEPVAGGGVEVRGTRREILAWMLTRHEIPAAPNLETWG
jgi:hypothetical protein